MKNLIVLSLFFVFCVSSSQAQNSDYGVEVGDEFVIKSVGNNSYTAIKFPKPNFIIKQGGIVNYKSLVGSKVKVVSLEEKRGSLIAMVKMSSNRRFFNKLKFVLVDINEAIKNNELQRPLNMASL